MINSVSDLLRTGIAMLCFSNTDMLTSTKDDYEGLKKDFQMVGDDIKRAISEQQKKN